MLRVWCLVCCSVESTDCSSFAHGPLGATSRRSSTDCVPIFFVRSYIYIPSSFFLVGILFFRIWFLCVSCFFGVLVLSVPVYFGARFVFLFFVLVFSCHAGSCLEGREEKLGRKTSWEGENTNSHKKALKLHAMF